MISSVWFRHRRGVRFVPGLRNLGNNCFLNVILLALASYVGVRIFLKSNIEQLGLSLVEKEVDGFPVLVSLAALFDGEGFLFGGSYELQFKYAASPLQIPVNLMYENVVNKNQLVVVEMGHDTTGKNSPEGVIAHWMELKYFSIFSCLREEFSASYVPMSRTLAVVATPSVRILPFRMDNDTSEPMRWRRLFLGPFDGIFRNCLTCQSCGSELLLNLSRFVNNKVGVQHRVEQIDRPQAELKYQPFISFLNHANSSRYSINLNGTETDKDHNGPTELNKNISKSTAVASDDTCGQFQVLNEAEHESSSAAGPMYRLVSVFEHFKTAGGGHYVVYRGVLEEADGGNDDGRCNDRPMRWFRISDSDVSPASKEDVLAAEASLLFYERCT
ncbi:Ubiquitin carboxyl-terminal hydrolase 27-like protein [Drosera capensis]